MMPTAERLMLVAPEILMLSGAVIVSVLGLSRAAALRASVPFVSIATLIAAIVAVSIVHTPERAAEAGLPIPMLGLYGRSLIAAIGIGLVAVSIGSVDRRLESAFAKGLAPFDPIRTIGGEFHAFMLFSLAGAMLVTVASDLIWLFLAIELSSLPTYIMVATSRGDRRAQEAAVKYFFLGAMSTAVLLYGFAMLYGACGSLELPAIAAAMLEGASESSIGMLGIVLVIVGLCFKITAVPMHFYAPDVYEGASIPTTNFLSFVPKATGFFALMSLLAAFGWSASVETPALPPRIEAVLWMIAALTMTLGNVGALLQRSVKRMMAYSSISHSGYMLVGIVAGPQFGGFDAVLLYLLVYGLTNIAIFGAMASIERKGFEIDSFDDLAGLRIRHPWASAMLAIGAGSLIGLPPLLGFWGKLDLFVSGVSAGQVPLVVIMALNSAVSVWYYLRLAGLPTIAPAGPRADSIEAVPSRWPLATAVVAGFGIFLLPLALSSISAASSVAGPDAIDAAESAADVASADEQALPPVVVAVTPADRGS
jgi:NADH-quinone oxidoreductase subunit N